VFQWFRRTPTAESWNIVLTDDGMAFQRPGATAPTGEVVESVPDDADLSSLLLQLEDDGYAVSTPHGYTLLWPAVYAVLEHSDYRSSLGALRLPPVGALAPILESRDSLADNTFTTSISAWHDGTGRRCDGLRIYGAAVKRGGRLELLPKQVWVLLQEITTFLGRAPEQRHDRFHREAWGRIRQLALAANGRLDDFLYRSVVLTPEKLEIGLRKADAGGTKVVEVAPSFQGAPPNWLDTFDRLRVVPDRYDIPTPEGIVQVLITPPVRTVLTQLKRLPGRRVAGVRAEAFLANPFAALGEDASQVIDPGQFERARADAGLTFEQFSAYLSKDAMGYPVEVGLIIEGVRKEGLHSSETLSFEDDSELGRFIELVQGKLDANLQFCGWKGYDFELLGDTPAQLATLKQALSERAKPRVLVSYAQIYDLSLYSPRIEAIGIEKTYYSPFIAKRKDHEGWFPENVVPVISWIPEGESEAVAVPLTEEAKEQIKIKLAEAEQEGKESFELKGFPKPVPVREAKFILETFKDALEEVKRGTFDPARQVHPGSSRNRPSPVIKANIQSIDYEEARRDVLLALPQTPELPLLLKHDVRLKDHQITGITWLQHLFGKAPSHCRGAVLADDMGLGKTWQLLAMLAWVFEKNPRLEPALVVAPLSLLENWKEEAERFLLPGALRFLTVYGDTLTNLRVPRAAIDQQLQAEGLVRFLRPGWRGNASVVLTTYETLRDLEFSFAAEKWSVMVCDEAQRIKNPNAMMTRAAKKQNVKFKIACTGTPVENTLADLWCLFDFVQPGLLGALDDFGRRYRKPIEAETEEEKARVEELRMKIAPQILRRTKEEVAKDLPKKFLVESCRRLPLSGYQRSLYANAIEMFKRRHDPTAVVPFKNHLGLLHYLRLICTDPRRHGLDTFKPDPLRDYRLRAPKLEWLLGTLDDIRRKQEKVIIFCEFRAIQRMLRHYVNEMFGYSPDVINGDTSASASHTASRQKRIKAFQASPGFGVLILSPVAVGFGVNIQGANHVVHYTRTWNPAKEDQATDRAYRIGQTRDVYVYYPVVYAEDFVTFDVKLDQLLERKRELARDMLNGAGDIRPGDFRIDEVVPGGVTGGLDDRVTLDDALRMNPSYFECLIAAIWQKKGFKHVYRTPDTNDDGVDVVAISGHSGELVQCKTSMKEGAELSWEAIKDVVTGEAAYRLRHPGIAFQKAGASSQFFNEKARGHARLNAVELYDQVGLGELLVRYPVSMMDVERFLHSEWEGQGA